jgi:hypothetical protein
LVWYNPCGFSAGVIFLPGLKPVRVFSDNIDFRLNGNTKFLHYGLPYPVSQIQNFLPGGIAVVHEYQGLVVMYACIAIPFALEATLFYQPTRRNFIRGI